MNIWCIGRNYVAHANELGNKVENETPLIFLKAGSCLVTEDKPFALPKMDSSIHHEIEIAVRVAPTLDTFDGMAIALDLTAREAQTLLKSKAHPWTLAKSFINACPISRVVPYVGDAQFKSLSFELRVGDSIRQTGQTRDMVFLPREILVYLRGIFPVCAGDWLLTGTPAGVAAIAPGDTLNATIHGVVSATWTVAHH